MRRARPLLPAVLAVLLLAGCGAEPATEPSGALTPPDPAPTAAATVRLAGDPETIATGLDVPWSIVPTEDGGALVSERDTARILHVDPSGGTTVVVDLAALAQPEGEGGLLGLALHEGLLYAYVTTPDDNRIVRMPYDASTRSVGAAEDVLTGVPRAGTHNGGRIAFGPDGMLYATTGDAQDRATPQDPTSLAGKILRLEPDGTVPVDNPTAGSPVYSLGHRNPQGIAWTEDGTMIAAEFGQDTWDELNRIEPGGNYGWPVVEGATDDERFIAPLEQWTTDESSPSGIAIAGGTVFIAGLGGERLWIADLADPAASTASLEGVLGRIRDVVTVGDELWLITNNTGRGTPRDGDDRLVRVPLDTV